MSKQFPHVHSFRLSDSDEQNLKSLMKRFHIDFSRDQSKGFRLFLKRLSKFISDLDPDGDAEGEMHSAAYSHSVAEHYERSIQVPADEEISEEISSRLKERGRVGFLLRNLTFKELKEERKQLSPRNIAAKERELRKRLRVPDTNLGVTAAEIIRKYEELRNSGA